MHKSNCPSLVTNVEVPHEAMAAEAEALTDRYVKHRVILIQAGVVFVYMDNHLKEHSQLIIILKKELIRKKIVLRTIGQK